ncbi:MAG: hypothetical protein LUC98_10890 [Lachnospiraceae bacterium]|nr:hypothetical protein [Lachnospiraceae bacterium]
MKMQKIVMALGLVTCACLLMACGSTKTTETQDREALTETLEELERVLNSRAEESDDEEREEEETVSVEEESVTQSQSLEGKLAELQTSFGIIDENNYNSEKRGISSFAFCDINADDVEELLTVYIDGDFSGEYDNASVWTALYGFEGDEIVLLTEQQIATIDYCDAMSVRLFFSEQQAAYCIVTAKELVGAYTGAREFVSELYKVSENGITLRRHWQQNSIENAEDSQDDIIAEMKRVGIPYMNLNYISYVATDAATVDELLLLHNTVSVEGDEAAERTYELSFTTYDELNAQNGGNELLLSDEGKSLIQERNNTNNVQETELKVSAREAVQVVENLFAGQNGVVVDYNEHIYDGTTSGEWCPAVDFSTIEEVKAYVHSMVSDDVYARYFYEDSYMELDGKVYLSVMPYDAYIDMDSLEIEKIEGDIYIVSVDEYLGHTSYGGTDLITLQQNGDGWFVLDVSDWTESGIAKGYSQY